MLDNRLFLGVYPSLHLSLGSPWEPGFLLCGVGRDVTGDKRAEVLGGDYGSPAHPRYAQPSCSDVIVDGGSAQTGRLTCLADAVAQLLG